MRPGRLALGVCVGVGLIMGPVSPIGIAAAQDAPPGKPFDLCSMCHSIDGGNGTGPTLKGVIGRAAGSVPGFRYSRAMKNSKIVWDAASLDRYLTDPQAMVPGNVMPLSGVPDPNLRAAIIAYLKTVP